MAFYQRLYCVSVSDHTTTKMWLVTVSKERVKWHKLEDRNNSWGNVHRVNGHLFGKAVLGEEINNFYRVIVTWGWPSEKIPIRVDLIEHLVAKRCRWRSYVIAHPGSYGSIKHEAVRKVRGWKACHAFSVPSVDPTSLHSTLRGSLSSYWRVLSTFLTHFLNYKQKDCDFCL